MEERIQWNNTFNVLEENTCQPRILYPVKILFSCGDELKAFQTKENNSLPADLLYKMC